MDYKEYERSFRYRRASFTIPSLLDSIRKTRLRWDPMFTYTKPWSQLSKTKYIESLLVGMPTSDIWCEENHFGELFVLDGVQRLICLDEFFSNSFQLQGLKLIPSLEGCYYSDIPYRQASIFQNRSELGLTIISYDTDAILKFEFFKRIHADSYRFPIQSARNYAFRDQLYFLRNLQEKSDMYLIQKNPPDQKFSIGAPISAHREASELDELFLLLCYIALLYHERIKFTASRFDDLLDAAAIHLHETPDDMGPLSEVVIATLKKVSYQLNGPLLLSNAGGRFRGPRERQNYEFDVDSDDVIAYFVLALKGERIDTDDLGSRRMGYRGNRSAISMIREIQGRSF